MQVYDAVLVSINVQPGICKCASVSYICFYVSYHIRANIMQHAMKVRVMAQDSSMLEKTDREFAMVVPLLPFQG